MGAGLRLPVGEEDECIVCQVALEVLSIVVRKNGLAGIELLALVRKVVKGALYVG